MVLHAKIWLKLLIISGFLLSFVSSYAYDFRPTDAEWQAWPGHCKAKYVWTNIGSKSKFVPLVGPADKAELVEWESAGVGNAVEFPAIRPWFL